MFSHDPLAFFFLQFQQTPDSREDRSINNLSFVFGVCLFRVLEIGLQCFLLLLLAGNGVEEGQACQVLL